MLKAPRRARMDTVRPGNVTAHLPAIKADWTVIRIWRTSAGIGGAPHRGRRPYADNHGHPLITDGAGATTVTLPQGLPSRRPPSLGPSWETSSARPNRSRSGSAGTSNGASPAAAGSPESLFACGSEGQKADRV